VGHEAAAPLPQRRRFRPGSGARRHVACLGHGGGGHTKWRCVACPQDEPPVYGPPLAKHCTALETSSSDSTVSCRWVLS
jgi:hypothetical protein